MGELNELGIICKYDPTPGSTHGEYLTIESEGNGAVVDFIYCEDLKSGSKKEAFELHDSRFYANVSGLPKTELVDCFSDLTTTKLEKVIVESLERGRTAKVEKEQKKFRRQCY